MPNQFSVNAVVPNSDLSLIHGFRGTTNQFPVEISGESYEPYSITFIKFSGSPKRDGKFYGEFLLEKADTPLEFGIPTDFSLLLPYIQ